MCIIDGTICGGRMLSASVYIFILLDSRFTISNRYHKRMPMTGNNRTPQISDEHLLADVWCIRLVELSIKDLLGVTKRNHFTTILTKILSVPPMNYRNCPLKLSRRVSGILSAGLNFSKFSPLSLLRLMEYSSLCFMGKKSHHSLHII